MAGQMREEPLMLSVSGARGIVGKTMTRAVAFDYAAAFGEELGEGRVMGGQAPTLVVIGRDCRASGVELLGGAAEGLRSVGFRVIDLGLCATPTTAVMVDAWGAAGGMVITASHNPVEWNGLKCLMAPGVAPPAEVAKRIIEKFRKGRGGIRSGCDGGAIEMDDSGARVHVERVLANVDVARIRQAKFRVVLDSVNGAGGPVGERLLSALGVETVLMNREPTGVFGRGAEPIAENLGGLCEAVRAKGAHAGFALDPDADRLAIVDERGRSIGEEYTLAMAMEWVLSEGRDDGLRRNGRDARPAGAAGKARAVAANLSTSRMIDDVAKAHGAVVHRTAVGEANVAKAMRRNGCVVGGEGNGGVIWPRVCWVRDGISAMAMILSLMAKTGRSLSQVVATIPSYAIEKTKIEWGAGGTTAAALEAIKRRFAGARMDERDGVRVDFDEKRSWVHVRASNTEPIVRVIAEAPEAREAKALVEEAVRAVRGATDGGGRP